MKEPAMAHRSAFHLDCTAVFPACRFDCTKCIAEIRSVFLRIQGVTGLHAEGQGVEARLIIVHDPSTVTAEQLMEVFKRLPSFYRASFTPALLG
jgi:hypothetical protein